MENSLFMELSEIEEFVDRLSSEERMHLQGYLDDLDRRDDPANAADLTRRMREMDAGMKVTLAEAKRMCQP